jgi:SAM-dependent methyltransferase
MSMQISKSIEIVKKPWIDSPYYDRAEKWTHVFWNEHSIFKRYFDQLELKHCAELACGHGRHSEQLLRRYSDRVSSLFVLDVVEKNIAFTKDRLSMFGQVRALLIEGSDFRPIESDALTSIFCYDAMVHFSPDIVESYLLDAARVLAPGGRALFHHSNHDAPETGTGDKHYGRNPQARNHMTLDLFSALANQAGLTLLDSMAMNWGGVPNLDRVSLLERPMI